MERVTTSRRRAKRLARGGLMAFVLVAGMVGGWVIVPVQKAEASTTNLDRHGGSHASPQNVYSLLEVNGTLYAGAQDGVWVYSRATWTILRGSPGNVHALVNIGGTIYAGADNGGNGVWSYRNGKWTEISHSPSHVDELVNVNGTLFAESYDKNTSTYGGMWSYSNSTWHEMANIPWNTDSVAYLDGTWYAGTTGASRGVSVLNHGTWTAMDNSPSNVWYLFAVKDELFAETGNINTGSSTMWSYSPATHRWMAMTGRPGFVTSMANADGTLFAGSQNSGASGLWSYGTGNWTRVNGTPTNINALLADGNTLYIAGDKGVQWMSVPRASTYTVYFNANGGSSVADETVSAGGRAVMPTNPWRTGYTFAGWYTDSSLTHPFDFNTPITSNTTLYAKWNINSYTVSFNSDGGSWVGSETVNYGGKASQPNNPTRPGYYFAGWYTDSTLRTPYDFSSAIVGNTTLYAKWSAVPVPTWTPLTITSPTVFTSQPGQLFYRMLTATGGSGAYTWSVVNGLLPSGLVLIPSTGTIEGATSYVKPVILTVQVTDTWGQAQLKQIVLDMVPTGQREMVWQPSGTVSAENLPAIVAKDGGVDTTYMPIWYVMQMLKSYGVTSNWDGHNWDLFTAGPVSFDYNIGNGNTNIYVNGKLVKMANTIAAVDPSSHHLTTYMPIWYVQQIMNVIGIQNTWDGTTWNVLP